MASWRSWRIFWACHLKPLFTHIFGIGAKPLQQSESSTTRGKQSLWRSGDTATKAACRPTGR
jgi:hypothetical protein